MHSKNKMDLSELINQLCTVSISTQNIDDIIMKIIMYMHQSSEEGNNNYTYYYTTSININLIINNLLTQFPDIHIRHNSDMNNIFIDWS